MTNISYGNIWRNNQKEHKTAAHRECVRAGVSVWSSVQLTVSQSTLRLRCQDFFILYIIQLLEIMCTSKEFSKPRYKRLMLRCGFGAQVRGQTQMIDRSLTFLQDLHLSILSLHLRHQLMFSFLLHLFLLLLLSLSLLLAVWVSLLLFVCDGVFCRRNEQIGGLHTCERWSCSETQWWKFMNSPAQIFE